MPNAGLNVQCGLHVRDQIANKVPDLKTYGPGDEAQGDTLQPPFMRWRKPQQHGDHLAHAAWVQSLLAKDRTTSDLFGVVDLIRCVVAVPEHGKVCSWCTVSVPVSVPLCELLGFVINVIRTNLEGGGCFLGSEGKGTPYCALRQHQCPRGVHSSACARSMLRQAQHKKSQTAGVTA